MPKIKYNTYQEKSREILDTGFSIGLTHNPLFRILNSSESEFLFSMVMPNQINFCTS